MKIYIDLFFLFNMIMDMTIIISVSILLKRNTNYLKIILSSFIGGLSSFVLFTSMNKIIIEIITIIIMIIISFGYKGIRYLLENILYAYMLSILLGGLIYLFNSKVSINIYLNYLIIIAISIEVMILYIKENRKMKNNYNNYFKVDIYFKENDMISLVGFLDTGNNLYDPYKNRPIILINDKFRRDDNFILVPYYTASGKGLLKCIRVDSIFIEGVGYINNVLVSFVENAIFNNGIDVILHKDLMKG